MEQFASTAALMGRVLRSGGANGADAAFLKGCKFSYGRAEIYIPWRGFNGYQPKQYRENDFVVVPDDIKAMPWVNKFHPNPSALSKGARSLMTRNTYQILGMDLNTPVDYVICWTKTYTINDNDSCIDGAGGTGQAIRIAASLGVHVYNLAHVLHRNQVNEVIKNWENQLKK
jgi:hypothetical protein